MAAARASSPAMAAGVRLLRWGRWFVRLLRRDLLEVSRPLFCCERVRIFSSPALQLARLHPMLHENLATLFGPAAQQGNNVKWTHEEWDENNTPSSSAEEGVIVNFIDLHLSLCWNDFFFNCDEPWLTAFLSWNGFFFKKDPFKQSKTIGPTRMYYVYQLQLYIRAH